MGASKCDGLVQFHSGTRLTSFLGRFWHERGEETRWRMQQLSREERRGRGRMA